MSEIKSYPKKPPVRLSKKEYHEQRERLYDEQMGGCKLCGKWFPIRELSFHHTDTGGMGMKGNDDEGYLCCLKCHPP